MSCVAVPCMVNPQLAIPCLVISCMVIPRVPFYTRSSMTISYKSDYFAYLASSYIRAISTQLKLSINLQNTAHNCEYMCSLRKH